MTTDPSGTLRGMQRASLWLSLLVAALVGCAGARLGFGDPLRVGIHTDYPPLAFRSDAGIVGIEPDFASLVGRALDRRLKLVPLERGELIPALEAGRVDVIMAGMSVTAERGRRVRFIEPYAQVGQMAMIRRDRVVALGPPEALRRAGARVGFVSGTTGEAFVRSRLIRAVQVPIDSVTEAENELRSGRIDYFIHDAPTAWRLGLDPTDTELMALYRPLTEEWLAWAVRSHDRELAARLDALVRAWQADGTAERIVDAWIPVRIRQ
jgi:ABC-type amino acid transport substrate-binding protein